MAAGRDDARAAAQALQDAHFGGADVAHFRWTTEDVAFAPVEDALLLPLVADLPFPCLEVGCGEGTNLARLRRRGTPVGVDRQPAKARFAARAVPGARLVAGDAGALPFRDASFRAVVVRDVLHHLATPEAALREVTRVLAPGGRLLLLEPNGRNPLIALQAVLIPAERGLRRFSAPFVQQLLAALPLIDVRVEAAEPLPLRRMLLHYRFGVPALGRWRPTAAALAACERLGGRLVPPRRWSYVVARARRA